jgi:glycerophosphoryl diester phosphodiesterase
VWTVNKRAEIAGLRNLKLDGVFTDFPARARP